MKNFDYWMLEILEKALKVYERKVCFTTRGKKLYLENKNPYNPLGQIRVIQNRIHTIREEFDKEIKKGLGITTKWLCSKCKKERPFGNFKKSVPWPRPYCPECNVPLVRKVMA